MKKVLLGVIILTLATLLCIGTFASDSVVYSAIDLYDLTSTGGGLALNDKLVNEDGSVWLSVYANGALAAGGDGTQFQFKIAESSKGDFLLKELPVFKMVYKTNIKDGSNLDTNLGMNYSGKSTRLWGYMPAYDKEKKSELIFDLSQSFSSGENLEPAYAWSNVDDASPVNYLRFKPYTGGKAIADGEYFNIEYIGFFKSESDAKNYKFDNSSAIKLDAIELNFGAIRTAPGKSFELVAVPSPSFASIDGVTYVSENEDIATVDANGKVTVHTAGETYIVAKTADGLEAKCHVFSLAGKLPAVHFVPSSVASESVVVNCLGDSITTYAPNPDYGMNYHDWWGKEYNVNNNDYGISGATLTANGNNAFVGRFMNMNDDADLVIVKGGTNDFGGTALGDINDKKNTTYIGALRILMDGLIEKYPNSQIVFLTPIKRCDGGQTVETKNGFGNTLNDYANAVVQLGELYGIPTVNIYTPEELDFTSNVISKAGHDENGQWHDTKCEDDRMPDGLHPSGKGHKIIADYLLEKLEELGVIAVHNTAFSDTITHWGCTNIDLAVSRGLFNGVTADEFAPNGTMTRGMLVTVLSRLAGDTENKTALPFTDVDAGAWFAPGVAFALDHDIVDSGDNFRPDDNITREELAEMLYRYAKDADMPSSLAEIAFTDAASISDNCKDGVAYCVNYGIIKGYDDNSFKPDASATRAEVATMINRFIDAK